VSTGFIPVQDDEPLHRPALLRPVGRTVRELGNMDENACPARGDPIGAGRSGEPGWGLLLLLWFAGNVVVATLAWFLVSLFLK
jgi:hypothetical protein